MGSPEGVLHALGDGWDGLWHLEECRGPRPRAEAAACLPPLERDGFAGVAPTPEVWRMGTVRGAFDTPARFGRLASQGSLEDGSTAHWAVAVVW